MWLTKRAIKAAKPRGATVHSFKSDQAPATTTIKFGDVPNAGANRHDADGLTRASNY